MEGYNDDTPPPTSQRVGGNGQEKDYDQNNVSFTTFARDSARRSLANNVALHKWLEAQERQQEVGVVNLLIIGPFVTLEKIVIALY